MPGENPHVFSRLGNLRAPSEGGGCPLAALWSLGSSYPQRSVNSGLQNVSEIITFSEPSSCTAEDFGAITQRIIKDFEDEKVDGPGSNRILFHCGATYTAVAGKDALGGVDGGWLQFDDNVAFPTNAGLDEAVAYLKGLVKRYPCMTFADAATLVGTIGTELAGGPAVAWMPGRRDASSTPTNPVIMTNLPDGSFNTASVDAFYTRMGLTPREMAALNGGGHSLGGAFPENSGWNGSFTPASDKFPDPKNLYFIQSYEGEWQAQVIPAMNGTQVRFQYILVDESGDPVFDADGNHIIRIPSDVALLFGGGESMAWLLWYAQDEEIFLKDYGRVLQRLGQIGAGRGWMPNKEQFEWLGVNGTATNYGTILEPEGGSPPKQAADFVYPQWVRNIMTGTGLTTASTAPAPPPSAALQYHGRSLSLGLVACAVSAMVSMSSQSRIL